MEEGAWTPERVHGPWLGSVGGWTGRGLGRHDYCDMVDERSKHFELEEPANRDKYQYKQCRDPSPRVAEGDDWRCDGNTDRVQRRGVRAGLGWQVHRARRA